MLLSKEIDTCIKIKKSSHGQESAVETSLIPSTEVSEGVLGIVFCMLYLRSYPEGQVKFCILKKESTKLEMRILNLPFAKIDVLTNLIQLKNRMQGRARNDGLKPKGLDRVKLSSQSVPATAVSKTAQLLFNGLNLVGEFVSRHFPQGKIRWKTFLFPFDN